MSSTFSNSMEAFNTGTFEHEWVEMLHQPPNARQDGDQLTGTSSHSCAHELTKAFRSEIPSCDSPGSEREDTSSTAPWQDCPGHTFRRAHQVGNTVATITEKDNPAQKPWLD